MRRLLAALVTVLVASLPATAGPIFSDDFDAQNGGVPQLTSPAFTGWTVAGGTVDLIGNGGVNGTLFDVLPGNGLYVDLDGSGTGPGLFATTMSFAPGTYLIEFALAGSQRGSTETVTVSLGSWSEVFAFNATDPLTPISRIITTAGGPLQFQNNNLPGSENVGVLLLSVSVSEAVIPEPATLAVFGGIALAGALGYRRRKAVA